MPPEVFQFGDVTVDLRRMFVLRGNDPVSLEPKTFDVLRYLLEHRDRLVTKEELLDAAWKDTFVTPNVLTRAIAQLRKAIGDDAFEARYIETVAKRGYRFIATVTVVGAPADVRETSSAPTAAAAPLPAVRRRWPFAAAAALIVAGIGFGIYAMREREPSIPASDVPSAAIAPRRFTTGSYSYSFPSISPDGRTIAYSSARDGRMEIFTSGFTPGGKESALTNDGGQNIFPDWSPDGQWIAYHSRKKGGIWIVPSGGGAARQVVDFGSQPSWTPDSERIVFTSDAGGMAAQSILWIVRRDGSERRELTKLGSPRGGHSTPSVSPTGALVAFSVSHGHISSEVWTAPLDGSAGTKLGQGAAPHFSGDCSAVYWIGRTIEGNDALMRVEIDERGRPVESAQAVQTFPGTFIGDFSVARDGTAVLWLYRALANLWSVDVPQQGTAQPVPITSDDVRNTQPRHFRDGRIVFNQYAVGQRPSAWVMKEDGTNRESLTVGLDVAVLGPQWAPDGSRVFAHLADFNRKLAFGWLDLATRQITRAGISAEGALSFVLSPDGREIAFHVIDEGGVINVWRQSVDGGPRKQVTFDTEAMSYPTWSPDGQSIVVEIKRGDDTHVGIVSKDGGPVEPLITERGQSWPFSFAPDNDRIAFAGARDGVWNIYYVSRKTKAVRQLTNFTSVEGYVRYPSWSHTRDSIVFERAEQRGSLWTAKLP
ncbi:MAG TPA: winged helix-turn-helix domain-containing protein [Vicinamibacterales bacterium]|nr:winged helix-turn-helix domain-containing protein [Vicinamibacterales bacterium]